MLGYSNSHDSMSQYGERLSTPGYGKAAMEGYHKDILNGFEQDAPRLNPVRNPTFHPT
jgi:hypothetical protein